MEHSKLDLVSGAHVIQRSLPNVAVEYYWLPPFEGERPVLPNRVKIVFSGHSTVWLDHGTRIREIRVPPGSAYLMNETPTFLRRNRQHSETIDLFLDMAFLAREAEARGCTNFALPATLDRRDIDGFEVDPVFLGLATRFRQMCLEPTSATQIELSSLAARLVEHIVSLQIGPDTRQASGLRLPALRRIAEFVEAHLANPLTVGDLADLAGMSTFHFAREFKAATGMAPWQYVQSRRIDRAKQLLLQTRRSVQDIVWSVGLENISYFRRQFRRHVGVRLSELRDIVN
jgi:AraC-like DNA-binding protein